MSFVECAGVPEIVTVDPLRNLETLKPSVNLKEDVYNFAELMISSVARALLLVGNPDHRN